MKFNKEVTIRLSDYNTLHWISQLVNEIDKNEWHNSSVELRTALSLSDQLSKKLRKKVIDKEGFTKPFKIKLPYYFASTLYFILQAQIKRIAVDDFHSDIAIQNIINELHKQLI